MTPARKAALQWIHDRGEAKGFVMSENPPSATMMKRMMNGGQLQRRGIGYAYTLTDKGRRALNGDME